MNVTVIYPERATPTKKDLLHMLHSEGTVVVQAAPENGRPFSYDGRRPLAKALAIALCELPIESTYPYVNLTEWLGMYASIGAKLKNVQSLDLGVGGESISKYLTIQAKSGYEWLTRIQPDPQSLAQSYDPYSEKTLEERMLRWVRKHPTDVAGVARVQERLLQWKEEHPLRVHDSKRTHPPMHVFTDEAESGEKLNGNYPYNFSMARFEQGLYTNVLLGKVTDMIKSILDAQPRVLLAYTPQQPEQINLL